MRSRHLVDPETLTALDEAPELVFSNETLAAIREVELPQLERSPNVTVSERIVPGVDGNPDIRVLIVTPAGVEAGAPGLFSHPWRRLCGTARIVPRPPDPDRRELRLRDRLHNIPPRPRDALGARSTISTPPSAGCTTTPQLGITIDPVAPPSAGGGRRPRERRRGGCGCLRRQAEALRMVCSVRRRQAPAGR